MKTKSKFRSRCKVCYTFTSKLKKEVCIECISCNGKESFESLNIARSIVHWYKKENIHFSLFPYRCVYCNNFHLGHSQFETVA